MTLLQMIMLGISAFFAYKVYEHIQTLQDSEGNQQTTNSQDDDVNTGLNSFSSFNVEELIQQADESFEAKDFQKALSFLIEADAKAPKNAEILFKLGFISATIDDSMNAIKYYKQSLDVDKNDEIVHNSLASIYRKEGEYASAKLHLNDSLAINDTNPVTYYNYGNLMIDMTNKDEAKAMYKKALEINPDFDEAKEELKKLEDEKK